MPLGLEPYRRSLLRLRWQLGELLGRPVDLVMPAALRNPYVRAGIEAHRELVYAA